MKKPIKITFDSNLTSSETLELNGGGCSESKYDDGAPGFTIGKAHTNIDGDNYTRYSIFDTFKKGLFIIVLSFSVSCTSKNNENCKEIFDKYYETNIALFMNTIPKGTDSLVARKRCECMLNKLYEIDSTFVLMSGAELERFIKDNISKINECNSIK